MYKIKDNVIKNNFKLIAGKWLDRYMPKVNQVLVDLLFVKDLTPIEIKKQYHINIEAMGSGIIIERCLKFDIDKKILDVKKYLIQTKPQYETYDVSNLLLIKYRSDDEPLILENDDELKVFCLDDYTTFALVVKSQEQKHLEKIKKMLNTNSDSGYTIRNRKLTECYTHACRKGYVSCIDYIYKEQYQTKILTDKRLREAMERAACVYGHIKILECMHKYMNKETWTDDAYRITVEHNQIDVLEYLFDSEKEKTSSNRSVLFIDKQITRAQVRKAPECHEYLLELKETILENPS